MQRIAVLLLCGGLWSCIARADTCDNVAAVAAGFAGGATGYGLVTTLGAASTWVGAGLYGAGIAVAGVAGRSAGEIGCNTFVENFERIGELYCIGSGFDYDCRTVTDVARSLAGDFLICPACTWDEVISAFLLDDESRQSFLRNMQYRKRGYLATTVNVLPRNQIGSLGTSVLDSYFTGLQAGFTAVETTSMSIRLK